MPAPTPIPQCLLLWNKYTPVADISHGSSGTTHEMKNTLTQERVCVKLIEMNKVDDYVEGEILNHRELNHPFVVRFREALVTDAHLAIVMDYAADGEMFSVVKEQGIASEDHARRVFQELVLAVDYIHSKGVCHRDLKLENILLHKGRVKVCDFGHSKNKLKSAPHSKVGTPNYMAPEVFSGEQYSGELADAWSCGVFLYVMLFKCYPFEDPDNKSWTTTAENIKNFRFRPLSREGLSPMCLRLLGLILAPIESRLSIKGICKDPWFLMNMPETPSVTPHECMEKDRVREVLSFVRAHVARR